VRWYAPRPYAVMSKVGYFEPAISTTVSMLPTDSASRIQGVCFGDEEAMAVELGTSTSADRDRQTGQLQCTIERPPRWH
jgi:hypothetical protein